jgi:hypothetical protein
MNLINQYQIQNKQSKQFQTNINQIQPSKLIETKPIRLDPLLNDTDLTSPPPTLELVLLVIKDVLELQFSQPLNVLDVEW